MIALLLSGTTSAVGLKQFDLSPDAFAEASVKARIEADNQVSSNVGRVSYAQNN